MNLITWSVSDKGRDHVVSNDDVGQQSSPITNHCAAAVGAAQDGVAVSVNGLRFAEELLGDDAEQEHREPQVRPQLLPSALATDL